MKFTLFEGTQYSLVYYRIEGELPGPTIMIQGGIQGDEVSGFVCAQILTRGKVRRGSLIIVPRANLPSVHMQSRQVNVDLNRRFDRDYAQYYEDRLARAIRHLLSGCDAFIHLHEGSGFYHPTYVDSLRNPSRWGQSIIIDTPVYKNRIYLAKTVNNVLNDLNPGIVPADYRFQLFNTDTFSSNTSHPEQRSSLTYYALNNVGIPAVAVEVSKNINTLPWKVRHMLQATELLISQFGVEAEFPELSDEELSWPYSDRLPITINGREISSGCTLRLNPGAVVKVCLADSGTNGMYEPAWAVFASDRPGVDLLNNPRLALAPFSHLNIMADGQTVARVNVQWTGEFPADREPDQVIFVCWLNGELHFLPEEHTLPAVEGDRLYLEGIWNGNPDEILNFKGYVTRRGGKNTGQDLGHEIVLEPDTLVEGYSLDSPSPDLTRCEVVRETPGEPQARFFVSIAQRKIPALKIKDPQGSQMVLAWNNGARHKLPGGRYVLEGLFSNGERQGVAAFIEGDPLAWGREFTIEPGQSRTITLRQAATFTELGRMTLTAF